MRCCMPECLFTVSRVKCAHLKFAVAVNYGTEVFYLAVELYAACSLVEAHSDPLDYFRCGHCSFNFADAAVL